MFPIPSLNVTGLAPRNVDALQHVPPMSRPLSPHFNSSGAPPFVLSARAGSPLQTAAPDAPADRARRDLNDFKICYKMVRTGVTKEDGTPERIVEIVDCPMPPQKKPKCGLG